VRPNSRESRGKGEKEQEKPKKAAENDKEAAYHAERQAKFCKKLLFGT
jgi:hypothetical protein